MANEEITKLVFNAISNRLREQGEFLELNKDTVLFGNQGVLDSLALTVLILDIEDRIKQESNLNIILANEKALSLSNSPFRTIETLVDYISDLYERHDGE